MKIIDLTHTIANDMTVYPGDDQPKNKIVCTVARDGYKETSLHIHSHNGTHMDSPNHVFENGITLDKIDVINFVGKAALIDCSSLMKGDFITYDFIENNKDIIDKSDFIITSKKKGIGFDTISVDSIDSTNYSNHLKILGNDILIFENLTNLNQINSDTFVFCALPLKFENSDGAPIRAIAMLD